MLSSAENSIGIYGDAAIDVVNRRSLGVLKYCAENNIQVCDFRSVNVDELINETLPPWRNRIDGIILCIGRASDSPEEQLGNWIAAGGVPAVSMSADWTDKRIPQVICNAAALANVAAAHLKEAGCKSFLFYGYAHSTGSTVRGMEFCKLLAAQGKLVINHTGEIRCSGTFADEEGAARDRLLIEHLKKLPKPLGIWAVNDQNATVISRICQNEKLQVPEQVKILGTDDTYIARMQLPGLSSIHTPAEEMGYESAKILHRMIQGKRVPHVTELTKFQIIARESTVGDVRMSGGIDDVLEHIERHACSGMTVDELPILMGISRRLFQELFLKQVGHTPMQEIQRVRLKHAKQLLRNSRLSIGRIAVMVGFNEQAAFCKFFRQTMKMSPKDYRSLKSPDEV